MNLLPFHFCLTTVWLEIFFRGLISASLIVVIVEIDGFSLLGINFYCFQDIVASVSPNNNYPLRWMPYCDSFCNNHDITYCFFPRVITLALYFSYRFTSVEETFAEKCFERCFLADCLKKKKITKMRTHKNDMSHSSAVSFLSFSSSNKSWTEWPSFDDLLLIK